MLDIVSMYVIVIFVVDHLILTFNFKEIIMSNLHNMQWPILRLDSYGRLHDEQGCAQYNLAPVFKNWREAEQWLIDNDARGTVESLPFIKKSTEALLAQGVQF